MNSRIDKPMLFYAFDRMKYEADKWFLLEPYSDMVPGKIIDQNIRRTRQSFRKKRVLNLKK